LARRTETVPAARWVTAAARTIDLDSDEHRRQIRRARQKWQERAFDHYDAIPEIRNAVRYRANCMSRLRLFPAQMVDGVPIPLDSAETGHSREDLAIANRVLTELRSPLGGQSQLLFDLATQLAIAADCFLVGRVDPELRQARWDVCSILEVSTSDRRGEWQVTDETGSKVRVRKTEGGYVARLWLQHPRRKQEADGALNGLSIVCTELDLLTRAINSTATSRLNMGILTLPEEASFGPAQITSDPNDGEERGDQLVEDLIEYFVTPIQNRASAAATVPFILQLKGDLIDHVKHLNVDRPFDELAIQLREELLARIANGMELPAESLTDKGGMNHWGTWNIDEETFRVYIEPAAIAMCSMLTSAYYRPRLLAEGLEESTDLALWYDPSDLISHPNQGQDAKDAHDRAALSDRGLRHFLNIGEEWAPSPEEAAARRAARQPAFPPTVRGPEESRGTEPPEESPEPVRAAAGERLDRLSAQLLAIETSLRMRLQVAADAAIRRVLDRAGAKVRSRIERANSGVRASLRQVTTNVANPDVCATLGYSRVMSLGFAEDDLLGASELADLRAFFTMSVSRAQTAMLEEIARYAPGRALAGRESLAATAQRQSSLAWNRLEADLVDLGRERVFGKAGQVEVQGEVNPDVLVPAGVIRAALVIAGDGASRTVVAAGTTIDPRTGEPKLRGAAKRSAERKRATVELARRATGITDGDLAREALRDADLESVMYEWVYGDPSSRRAPFEPHEELDGVEFDGWDDPVLESWTDFPAVSHYHPGDHPGCQCALLQSLNRL
jgi:hypothetical protein